MDKRSISFIRLFLFLAKIIFDQLYVVFLLTIKNLMKIETYLVVLYGEFKRNQNELQEFDC